MKDMEWKMLKKFHWKLNPPTSLSFIRLFVRYLALSPNGINEILDKSRYLIELSNCGEKMYVNLPKVAIKSNFSDKISVLQQIFSSCITNLLLSV